MPVSDYESFVLVEVCTQNSILRIIRTYEDKARSEDDLALLRDAFAPDHERRFDVIPVHHQPT